MNFPGLFVGNVKFPEIPTVSRISRVAGHNVDARCKLIFNYL